MNTPVSISYTSESESFPELNSVVREAEELRSVDRTFSSANNSNIHFRNLHKLINKTPIQDEDDIFYLVKQINHYISKNPEMNSIDSKELNSEITIKGYAFSKNHGELKLIKKYYTPMCRSKSTNLEQTIGLKIKPIEDKINTIEVMLNQLKQETSNYIKQMEIRINTIEDCLKVIQDDNNKQDIIISKVVNFINENFIEPQQATQSNIITQTVAPSPLELLKRKF